MTDADTDPRWAQIEDALQRYVGAGTCIYLMYRSPRRVKIGQAMDVQKRLTELRNDLDPSITLMGYCTASPSLETALHRIFHATRIEKTLAQGTEWFVFEPILGRLAVALNRVRKAGL